MSLSRWVGLPVSAIAISIVVVIANLGNTIVAPVLPSIRDYFNSSAAETALMVSGFGFGRLAMDLPAGFLTGRISPSKMFAAGILLSGGASALAAGMIMLGVISCTLLIPRSTTPKPTRQTKEA